MFMKKKEIQKRLGPDGCEEPPDQTENQVQSSQMESSNQQVISFPYICCLRIISMQSR